MSAGSPTCRASLSASFASGDPFGRVAGEYVTGHGHGELDRGVREVAAGPRKTSGPFGKASASTNAPVVSAMFVRTAQMVASTP